MKNFCEYYGLCITVSINSLSALNIIVNTILKYYPNQALTLLRMGSQMGGGGQKYPTSLKSVTHIPQ